MTELKVIFMALLPYINRINIRIDQEIKGNNFEPPCLLKHPHETYS